ncbi:hypothetical protein FI667_g11458, partial [Globisporangium splendens]
MGGHSLLQLDEGAHSARFRYVIHFPFRLPSPKSPSPTSSPNALPSTMIKTALLSVFAIAAAYSTPAVHAEEEAGKADIVLAGFQLASQIVPLIGGLFKNNKECQQVACWISTPKCYLQAADKVQNDIFQGRDGYRLESHNNQGAWARYWRVRTDVSTINTIASGKCGDGSSFTVSNCQTTGHVHC